MPEQTTPENIFPLMKETCAYLSQNVDPAGRRGIRKKIAEDLSKIHIEAYGRYSPFFKDGKLNRMIVYEK